MKPYRCSYRCVIWFIRNNNNSWYVRLNNSYSLLTLRLLMSYIYIYIYMEHLFLMFLDHTQRRSTVGRTPLDEWSARRRDLYLTTHDTHTRQISMPPVGFELTISAGERPAALGNMRERGHWKNIDVDGSIIFNVYQKIGCEFVDWIYLAQDKENGGF